MKVNIHKLILLLTVAYFFLLSYWMLFGFGRTPHSEYMYNLKPFLTIRQYVHIEHYNLRTWLINVIGNIGVFIPFGILLPLLARRGLFWTSILFLSGLFLLEASQLLSRRGSFDVDDFILNYTGFLIGYCTYRLTYRLLTRRIVNV